MRCLFVKRFLIQHPSPIIHHPSIHHPSFIIHHPSSTIHHSSFIIHHPSSIRYAHSERYKILQISQRTIDQLKTLCGREIDRLKQTLTESLQLLQSQHQGDLSLLTQQHQEALEALHRLYLSQTDKDKQEIKTLQLLVIEFSQMLKIDLRKNYGFDNLSLTGE